MAKKKIGKVELIWVCPNCGNQNLGTVRDCGSCGSPQPDDVEFIQAEQQELLSEEEAKAKSAGVPDIICAYCGTRNKGTNAVCTQCKASLDEGHQRKAGRVVGAYKSGPVKMVACPHCGTENPETNDKCTNCGGSLVERKAPQAAPKTAPKSSRGLITIIGVALLVLCLGAGAYMFLANKTSALAGVVDRVNWERTVAIEGFGPVKYQDWYDQVPSEGEIGSCSQEVRRVESEPVANSEEVCGTPYTVDSGDGTGDVVQDCEYRVYDDYCSYTLMEWSVVDQAALSGEGLQASWPDPALGSDERLGEDTGETYTVVFQTDDGFYTYTTDDYDLFQQFTLGSEWSLNVNTFGNVLSVEK
jgi:hypothetical protein